MLFPYSVGMGMANSPLQDEDFDDPENLNMGME